VADSAMRNPDFHILGAQRARFITKR